MSNEELHRKIMKEKQKIVTQVKVKKEVEQKNRDSQALSTQMAHKYEDNHFL